MSQQSKSRFTASLVHRKRSIAAPATKATKKQKVSTKEPIVIAESESESCSESWPEWESEWESDSGDEEVTTIIEMPKSQVVKVTPTKRSITPTTKKQEVSTPLPKKPIAEESRSESDSEYEGDEVDTTQDWPEEAESDSYDSYDPADLRCVTVENDVISQRLEGLFEFVHEMGENLKYVHDLGEQFIKNQLKELLDIRKRQLDSRTDELENQ